MCVSLCETKECEKRGAGRKLRLKPHGVTEDSFGVIDGLLSEVVNILKIRSIKSVGCSSSSLQAGREKPKATLPFNIHTYLHIEALY